MEKSDGLFGFGRGGGGWSRYRRGHSGFAAEYLEHDNAAGGALALDRLPPVLHHFFNRIGNFLFGLALDAISFWHRNSSRERASRALLRMQ